MRALCKVDIQDTNLIHRADTVSLVRVLQLYKLVGVKGQVSWLHKSSGGVVAARSLGQSCDRHGASATVSAPRGMVRIQL